MFDRDFEWVQLSLFTSDPGPGATLGVVSGRRRRGKTFLLRALCQATGGFYFAAEKPPTVNRCAGSDPISVRTWARPHRWSSGTGARWPMRCSRSARTARYP